jgi:ABC-type cobalt transport system substrate-binding protein
MKAFRYSLLVCLACSWFLGVGSSAPAEEKTGKWPGVDESVVEKIAKAQGREAREPIINTDQGDLLLFVFLLAGAVGGFVAGYYWRRLITEKAPLPDQTEGLKGPRRELH